MTRRVAAASRTLAAQLALAAAAAGLAAAIPLPAQAQLFADSEARRAILDLRTRVDEVQRDFSRRLDELQARIERVELTTRGQLENQNQIQQLREDLARLRGQLEVLTNELAQTQRRQRDVAAEIDERIKRFEPVAVTIDGRQFNVDVNERRSFEGAMNLFRNGDFRGASLALQQFLGAYPQSPYAPGAQYWLGSALYALKEPQAAITTLKTFLSRHPEHPRTPDALLTVGNALADTGDRAAAADMYRQVIGRFDGTPAAQSARERLQAVSQEPPPAALPAAPAAPAAPAGPAPGRPGAPQSRAR
jgi:tol-pal system protein YbgF